MVGIDGMPMLGSAIIRGGAMGENDTAPPGTLGPLVQEQERPRARLFQLPFAAACAGCRAWLRNCAGDEPTTRRNVVLNALSDW